MKHSIAVVGIGCRFPGGANSPSALWQLLKQSFDGIREVPADRWNAAVLHDPDPNKDAKIRNPKGGFISGVDLFDAHFSIITRLRLSESTRSNGSCWK